MRVVGKGRRELGGGEGGRKVGDVGRGEEGVGELGWWGKEESREFRDGGKEAGRWLREGGREVGKVERCGREEG